MAAVGMAIAAAAAAPATRPVTTAPAPTPAQAARIERLVSMLSSREWKARDKAEADLAALGDVAEQRLVKLAGQTEDPEVRARARSALGRIADLRRLGPTRVTLKVKDATPQQVFAEIARQGGVPVEAYRASLWRQRDWPKLTLDLAGEPFWAGVRAACVKSGLRPLHEGGDGEPGRVVLVADVVGDMEAPAAFSSSFMVLVNSLTKGSRFLLEEAPARGEGAGRAQGAAKQAGESLELQLTFYADPKFRIVAYPDEAAVSAVSDDEGNALPVPAPMRIQAFRPGSPIWQMRTSVRGVPPGCRRLTNLKGSFRVVLLEQSEQAEVADVMNARNVSRRAGGQSLLLQGVTREKDAQVYRARLVLSRNGLSQQEWRQEREVEAIRLVDANGRAMMRTSFDAQESGDQVVYDLQFIPAPGDEANPAGPGANAGAAQAGPAKLVFRIPLEPREVTVPFEFGEMPVQK